MKKILSFTVLLFFCWQFVGSYLYFQNVQRSIHEKAEQMIKNSTGDFHTLQFSFQEYQEITWINKHEFKFKSNLYDVRSITKRSEHINIVCLLDKDENQLINHYSNQIQPNQNDKESDTGSLVWNKILNSIYLPGTFYSIKHSEAFVSNSKHNIPYKDHQSSPHLKSIFSPPIYS